MPSWVQILLQILSYGVGGYFAHSVAANNLISKMPSPPDAPK